MTETAFFSAAYLTDYTASDREAVEGKAAEAATEALTSANVAFDAAMRAEAARVNDEEFDASHAAAYDSALNAAKAAISRDLKGTYGFISLGWR